MNTLDSRKKLLLAAVAAFAILAAIAIAVIIPLSSPPAETTAPPPETTAAPAQTLEQAHSAALAAIGKLEVSNGTTDAAILSAAASALKNPAFKAEWDPQGQFELTAAKIGTDGLIRGFINISDGANALEIEVKLDVPALPRPEPLPPSLGVFDNDFEIWTLEQFTAGDDDGGKLVFDGQIADGAVKLADGVTEAVYTSAEMQGLPDFNRLVMSWNADTPEGTWIEVNARVWLVTEDQWSEYISWGKWGTFFKRSSMNSYLSTLMPFVNISTDELTLREAGERAVKAQVQVTLHRDDPSTATPVLWGLYGTTKITGELIERAFPAPSPLSGITLSDQVDHKIPLFSQLVRSPNIASVMCSAATASMLVNYASEQAGEPLNLLPEEVAMAGIDYNGGSFGNWSYTMAGASAFGFKTHVEYSNIESIKRHLQKGNVIGASVNYSVDKYANNYLEGAYGSTPGHLIVIRGFKTVDGVDYFICNDAFAENNETVYREYKVSQFENCWTSKAIYVVEPGFTEGAGTARLERVEAKLVKTDTDKYELQTLDGEVVKLPKTPSPSGRAGFIAYITEPEIFSGAGEAPPVYKYIDAGTNSSSLLTLPSDVVSSRDFRLYVSNAADYPGKVFTVFAR